jgi:hypothetical protein
MKTILCALGCLAILIGKASAQTNPAELIRYSDLILRNGKILTTDRDDRISPPLYCATELNSRRRHNVS